MLESSLLENPPSNLKEIARRLGLKSPAEFYKRFPNLCYAVSERCRQFTREKIGELENALRAALLDEPPPTLTQVARRLRYEVSTLYERFSPLCRAISARHLAQRKLKTNKLA